MNPKPSTQLRILGGSCPPEGACGSKQPSRLARSPTQGVHVAVEYRVEGLGFRIQSLGVRVWSIGNRVGI